MQGGGAENARNDKARKDNESMPKVQQCSSNFSDMMNCR